MEKNREWITGMDLSTLLEVEQCGGTFYDRGQPGDAMDILKKYGMNMVRLRLWNDPFDDKGCSYGGGGNDLETTLKLAQRARNKGMGWLLDFHYSDFWADPGKQVIPKAWQGVNQEQLEEAVYSYTAQVLRCCRERGLTPSIVAVGNELSNGLLWPCGKAPDYKSIVRFVNAGIRAVREADSSIQVMLHLDNGGNRELYRTWFDQYFANGGEEFDYIGLSYYPFWHGTLDMLRDNMKELAHRYKKRMVVAEVSMGFTMEDYQEYEMLPSSRRKGMATRPELVEHIGYPMTREGQSQFMRDLLEVIRQVPENLGCGFFYWEPAWLPVAGSEWATPEACEYLHEKGPGGNEWANQALFDYDGNALSALETILKMTEQLVRERLKSGQCGNMCGD